MGRHLTLDIRGMAQREPLERVLGTVASFRAGDTLKLLTDFEPQPLYRILERDGFRHHAEPGEIAPYEVTIWADGPM
jgi:uncharacterized protein (DUF2249 family)